MQPADSECPAGDAPRVAMLPTGSFGSRVGHMRSRLKRMTFISRGGSGDSWVELFEGSGASLVATRRRWQRLGPWLARRGRSIAGATLLVSAATLVLQLETVIHHGCEKCSWSHSIRGTCLGPVQFACGVSTAWLVARAPGRQLRRVAFAAFLNWLSAFVHTIAMCWLYSPHLGNDAEVLFFLQLLDLVLFVFSIERAWSLTLDRLLALGTPSATRANRIASWGIRLGVTLHLFYWLAFACSLWTLWKILFWLIDVIAVFLLAVVLRALNDGRELAASAAEAALDTLQQEEALLAARSARDQVGALTLCAVPTIMRMIVDGVIGGMAGHAVLEHYAVAVSIVQGMLIVFEYLANGAAAMWYAGAFRAAVDTAMERQHVEDVRSARYAAAASSWEPHPDLAWHSKVCELALRGLSLEALLKFYSGLGNDYMSHWHPRHHTTADVVRHAVVPLSAARRSALAPILMEGKPTRAGSMVTHNWGNLFRDLVAAVVADALEEDEFDQIAFLLEHDVSELKGILTSAGKLDRTYWICAFAVNQHVTICDANPHDTRDALTNRPYPLCTCGTQKVFNDTGPTTEEGQSIPCEVNKFDTMMKALAASDPNFEQVVAIDGRLELFSRAWCVAELAAASAMGVRQRLKFRTASVLAQQEEKLRNLKIRNMEASRPEDKEAILRAISDPDEFDEKLQHMLFSEMLPTWNNLDALDQLRRLAKFARWQQVARRRRSIGIWSGTSATYSDMSLRTVGSTDSDLAYTLRSLSSGKVGAGPSEASGIELQAAAPLRAAEDSAAAAGPQPNGPLLGP